MKRIVVVEDSIQDQNKLKDCIEKFYFGLNEQVNVVCYSDGFTMLENFKSEEDIIFLDIDLPGMDGITLAKKIREKDEEVVIIFVSNLAQFALKGYEVSALDYIVKPFDYANIEHRLKRANKIKRHKQNGSIVLNLSSTNHVVVSINEICYIEKDANYLLFHLVDEICKVRGVFGDFEKYLDPIVFSYCIKGVLVNLSFVDKILNDTVYVQGSALPISRHRKKDFTNDLFSYITNRKGDMN